MKRNILPRYNYKINVDKDFKKSFEQIQFGKLTFLWLKLIILSGFRLLGG